MPKYHLKCPVCRNGRLLSKTINTNPSIYSCDSCGKIWKLWFSASVKRYLTQYDAVKCENIEAQTYTVPDDWEGEPIIYSVDNTTWQQINNTDNHEIRTSIEGMLRNGDKLFVEKNGQIIGEVILNRNSNGEDDSFILQRPQEI